MADPQFILIMLMILVIILYRMQEWGDLFTPKFLLQIYFRIQTAKKKTKEVDCQQMCRWFKTVRTCISIQKGSEVLGNIFVISFHFVVKPCRWYMKVREGLIVQLLGESILVFHWVTLLLS